MMVLGARATREERANGMADIPGITAARKILMTGTPICNRPKELFPLISFLDEITWSKKWEYQTRYCGACQDNGWNSDGASHLDELQQKLRSTIMIRRLKKDVMKELPPKLRRVVEFSPTGHMLEVAKEERAQYGSEAEYKAAIENMISHPTSAGDRPTYRKNCAIAKAQMKEVLAYLDEAIEESGKVIIFVWHREVYHLLRQHFGHKAVGMNGETPMAQRHAAVEAFQNDISIGAIVGQMITMGTGLTLTASSRVIFMELDDVPGNVSQAEDRAHRIGQEDNVLVEHLIVTGTIDAAMAKNCVYKQDIIDKALDHQKNPKAAAPLPASPVIQATPQPKQLSLL
jgi:SNF2 family DNA or RNA helicase